jgi:hypothetical protein
MATFTKTYSLLGGTSGYTVSNGKIVSPTSSNFIGKGINVYEFDFATVVSNSQAQPLRTLFPGCNFIRLPCYTYNSPSYYQTQIDRCTANGIVVLMEHHVGAGGGSTPMSGQALIDENNWFQSIATAFKSYPNVWFGTLNEPSGPGDVLTANQVSNYNTIRATGNSSIIAFQTLGDYPNGNALVIGAGHGLIASSYTNMTNVIWDVHIYNGLPSFNASTNSASYTTNQITENNMVASYIQQAQTITSKDGIMPVIIGEYGISTDDTNLDPGGTQCCIAVQQSGVGSTAWNWSSGGSYDILTQGSPPSLTSYGQQVASYVNS